ncbi:chromosome segregation ATPase [Paenibacillus anaericanus]|uniref:cell division protein ZapA n=1 Tax=Paenibacillus anaericanus TaxID=170367 RepID=UPI002781D2D6|nr:cell division protein ZapA [Paenibacillus anaericanus]MDQ0087184.1 chromosome segregation ATPase [Paenibacillus anaericanus]
MTTPDRITVNVEIYGTSYKIVGSSAEYMHQVARRVDEHMRAISKMYSHLDTPRLAVLAAVRMAEEAVKTDQIRDELQTTLQEKAGLSQEISVLGALHTKQENMYKTLQEEQHQLKMDNKLISEQLVKSENTVKERAAEVNKLTARVQELERQLAEERGGSAQLRTKLSAVEQEAKKEKGEVERLLLQVKGSQQREEAAKVAEQRFKDNHTKLEQQAKQMQASLQAAETETKKQLRLLQEAREREDKLRSEVTSALQNEKSWQKLAEMRNEELSRLEIGLLEAADRNEKLEELLESTAKEADLTREGLQVEKNVVRKLNSEVELLRSQMDQVTRERTSAVHATKSLEDEKSSLQEQLARLGERLNEAEREVQDYAALAEEQETSRLEAESRELQWREQLASAEQELVLWRETEADLQRQLSQWQKESAAGGEQVLTLSSDFSELKEQREQIAEQLRQISDSYEIVSHEYRLLQVEREVERDQVLKTEQEYSRLKEDYSKLQSEYNEWIELIEQE